MAPPNSHDADVLIPVTLAGERVHARFGAVDAGERAAREVIGELVT